MPAPAALPTAAELHHLWCDKVIAVIRAETIPDPTALCQALRRGGIRTIEFTFTTPDVETVVEQAVRKAGGECTVGVGTVLTAAQADSAIAAGARFLVTPCVSAEVAEVARRHDVAVLMGAMTPGEVLAAHRAGAAAVKIFPAGALGPQYLADLHGPFPDLALVPSGGINVGNAADYLRHGAAAVTAGTSVATPALIADGNWPELARRAAEFVAALQGTT
jgi:2-dehydro-3-deoxyphosphogluconate aldolase/(4S)-4-hydroxy-2-oxoglutarate aldolase